MTVYLNGYYGMQNSGDDALLWATIFGCKEYLQYSDLTLSNVAPINFDGLGQWSSYQVDRQRFRGEKRFRNYWRAWLSQKVVFGGGSVMHSEQDIAVKLHMLKLSGSAGLALGVGLGPFENTAAERACADLLHRCEFVGVRDQASYELAQAIAPNAPVKKTFDLAPLLLKSPNINNDATGERHGICVSLCNLLNQSIRIQQNLPDIANTLVEVSSKTGESITLLDFNGHAVFGDHTVHLELANLLLNQGVKVEHIPYQPDPIKVLRQLRQYRCVVAMRLHSAILGFLADTPVISLNYHSKCLGWCEQVGMPSAYILDINAFDSVAFSQGLHHAMSETPDRNRMNVENALEETLKNWSLKLS